MNPRIDRQSNNDGKLALVTGASRGLGRALAETLVGRGWRVIADARDGAALREWLAPLGEAATAVPGDIADPAHRAELARRAAAHGRLDLLVASAGALGPSPLPPLLEYPLDALDAVLHTNVTAQLGLLKTLWPLLRDTAAVITVTSDAARKAYPGWGGYGASKAALEQLTAVLAAEHPERRIYAVDPGDMRTAMHQAAFPGEDIGDRPLPGAAARWIVRLAEGYAPNGRYSVSDLVLRLGSEPAAASTGTPA